MTVLAWVAGGIVAGCAMTLVITAAVRIGTLGRKT